MLYREIIAVCSQIHIKHTNTLCVQNVELLNVKLAVHIVTTVLYTVNARSTFKILVPVNLSFHFLISPCSLQLNAMSSPKFPTRTLNLVPHAAPLPAAGEH